VPAFITAFDAFLAILRVTVFVLAVVAAVVCLIDWLARTKRISPFSPVARYMRRVVDPVMEPIERRVVRAGGLPSNAPWWALVVIVVGSLVLLAFLGFLRDQVLQFSAAAQGGALPLVRMIVFWTFRILQFALIIRVISSWIRISPYSPWIRWTYVLTEPILRPLRNIVPTIGMIDITPIVAYFLLAIIQFLVLSAL
jgi:YggT family protein